jgi:hypothetical protein
MASDRALRLALIGAGAVLLGGAWTDLRGVEFLRAAAEIPAAVWVVWHALRLRPAGFVD